MVTAKKPYIFPTRSNGYFLAVSQDFNTAIIKIGFSFFRRCSLQFNCCFNYYLIFVPGFKFNICMTCVDINYRPFPYCKSFLVGFRLNLSITANRKKIST